MGLVKKDGTWFFQYWEGGRRRRKSLATGDKREADQRAEKFRKARRARRCGFDSFDETEARPFSELVDDYAKDLLFNGCSTGHAEKVKRRILTLCSGARSVLDVTPDSIRRRLRRLAEVGTPRGFKGSVKAHPFSAKTSNDYRAALHGLFSWLVKSDLWPENPVARVPRVKAIGKTREREALTPEQLEKLFSKVPLERSVFYRLAANTGLRRSELKALRWSSLDLQGGEVTLEAKHAKNRKDVRLPLNESTVAALEVLLAAHKKKNKGQDVPKTAPVFSRIPLVRTFYSDLKKAELQETDGFEGWDLHALRVSFITNLQLAGVSLAQAQKLARHSDPRLTANVYTKPSLLDDRAAVAKIDRSKPEEKPDDLRRRDVVLGGGPPDTKEHPPTLTTENSQRGAKNAPSPEARKDAGLKAMHPVGFEPTLWGSKPEGERQRDRGLRAPGVVPGGGPGEDRRKSDDLADELLERVDDVSDAEAAALARAAKILRARSRRDEDDDQGGEVLRLAGGA